MDGETFGRILLLSGILLAVVGLLVMAGARLPFFGQLPGDVSLRWGGGSFFFPIVSCVVLSVVLTIVLNLVLRLLNRW